MAPGFTSDSSDLESVLSIKLPAIKKARRNSAGPKYICSHQNCHESFRRLDQLDRHEFKHTGVRKHSCHYENCEKSYAILTHLKRHVRNTHERQNAEPIKNIPCELDTCNKRFTSLCNMYRHVRETHENPKIYHCQYCNETFKQKMKMRRHEIQKHTGSYPYNCDKCQKGFYQEQQWQKHVANCKVYPCLTCNIEFNKWSLYLKHCKATQHSQQGFQCEYCSRMYVKSVDLKNHVAAKHLNLNQNHKKNQNDIPIAAGDSCGDGSGSGGVGDGDNCAAFKCDYINCQRSYAYEKNLKQHKLTAHEGKRFKCTEINCTKIFSSMQNLQKHLKREHLTNSNNDNAENDHRNNKALTEENSKTKRKQRKDAGLARVSNLSKLSGLIVDKDIDKGLRHRETDALDFVTETLVHETVVEQILNSI